MKGRGTIRNPVGDLMTSLEPPRSKLLPATVPAADFRITDSLADLPSWKARTIEGEYRAGAKRPGEFDRIGAVMVRTTGEPAFIPLAVGDTHHNGFSALRAKASSWRIDVQDYVPIWAHGYGNIGTFFYSKEDGPVLIEACQRWLAAGGPETLVSCLGHGSHDGSLAGQLWTIGMRDFIAGRAMAVPGPHGLMPLGERFYGRLAAVTAALAALRDPEAPYRYRTEMVSRVKRFTRAVEAMAQIVDEVPILGMTVLYDHKEGQFWNGSASYEDALTKWRDTMQAYVAEDDVLGLERMIFTHRGLKNMVHMRIKEEMGLDPRYSTEMAKIFGNLALINDLLARLSPGLEMPAPGVPRRVVPSLS